MVAPLLDTPRKPCRSDHSTTPWGGATTRLTGPAGRPSCRTSSTSTFTAPNWVGSRGYRAGQCLPGFVRDIIEAETQRLGQACVTGRGQLREVRPVPLHYFDTLNVYTRKYRVTSAHDAGMNDPGSGDPPPSKCAVSPGFRVLSSRRTFPPRHCVPGVRKAGR